MYIQDTRDYIMMYDRKIRPEYGFNMRCEQGTAVYNNIVFTLDGDGCISLPDLHDGSQLLMPSRGVLCITGTFYVQQPVYKTRYFEVAEYRTRAIGTIMCEDITESVADKTRTITGDEYDSSDETHHFEKYIEYADAECIKLDNKNISYNRNAYDLDISDAVPMVLTAINVPADVRIQIIANRYIIIDTTGPWTVPPGKSLFTNRIHSLYLRPIAGGDAKIQFLGLRWEN